MRRWILMIAFLLLSAPGALAQTPTFAGVEWGTPAAAARRQVVEQGFVFEEVDEDGDLEFSGRLMGQDVQLWLVLVRDSVQRATVALITPDHEAQPVYRELVGALTQKYGEPTARQESFAAPYQRGDGREEEAIREGSATFDTRWLQPDGSGLLVRITRELVVVARYDGPGWIAEQKRLRAQDARVFE